MADMIQASFLGKCFENNRQVLGRKEYREALQRFLFRLVVSVRFIRMGGDETDGKQESPMREMFIVSLSDGPQ